MPPADNHAVAHMAPEEVRQARRLKPDPTPDLCNGLNSLGNQSLLEHWERLPDSGKDHFRRGWLVTHPTGDMPTPRMVLSTTTKQYKRKNHPLRGEVDDGQIRMELMVMNAMVNPNEKILQKCIFRWDKMTSIHASIRKRSWLGADSTVGGGTARTRWKKTQHVRQDHVWGVQREAGIAWEHYLKLALQSCDASSGKSSLGCTEWTGSGGGWKDRRREQASFAIHSDMQGSSWTRSGVVSLTPERTMIKFLVGNDYIDTADRKLESLASSGA